MSTVLIFVIIPVVVIGVVASLTLAGGSSKNGPARRYRPGRPYDFQPIWFLSSPEQITTSRAQLGSAHGGPADNHAPVLEAGPIEDSAGHRVLPGGVGGASDRW